MYIWVGEKINGEGRGRTLCPPVVHQTNLLGQAERDEVGQAPEGEHDGQEGEGGRSRVEAALVRLVGKRATS